MASGDVRRLIDMIKDQDGEGSGLDTDLLRGLPADFTCSKNANGYQKLPTGLIIQWGRGLTTSDSNGIASFTFPIAFPNACFQVVAVDVGDACYDYGIEDGQINTTGFSCDVKFSNGNVAASVPVGIRYIAIGY